MNPKNFIDETGHRYGRLLVLERYPVKGVRYAFWKCRCDCGTEVVISGKSLREGVSRSCGCLRSEVVSEKMTKYWAQKRKAKEAAQ